MTTDTVEADPESEAVDDSGDQNRAGDPPRRLRWRGRVLVLALLAALAAAVWTGLEVRTERAADARDRAALAIGRDAAVAFTSYHHQRIDEDLDRVATMSTGDFREEFTQALGALTEAIRQAEGVSEGTVVHAGLARSDQESAVVLAAVDATVSNKQTEQPSLRRYRLQITLDRDGDSWLISDISPVT